tara:strand:+ start:6520 stop:7293 length:774 start_codon:yes stop_codon:yes gene_type:complete
MSHISYSELKNWNFCSFYHKLVHIDKIDGFKGNEFTAFGTAIHDVCEKKLLKENIDDARVFIDSFSNHIAALGDGVSVDRRLVDQMVGQGLAILPEVEEALNNYFGEFEVASTEEQLYEEIEDFKDYKFKGFIDAVLKTNDGRYHIVDWKTCSWGWNFRRRTEPMTTYQLTLYKYYWCKKHDIDPAIVDTHFALLKRTAKNERVEFFKVSSGNKKTNNALELLKKALHNIKKGSCIKNRLSCTSGYGCDFYKTEHCP